MEEKNLSKNETRTALLVTNYVKRFLESRYTDIFETDFGKKLKNLSTGKKYGLEALFYGCATLLNEKLPGNTIPKKVFQDVLMDAFPEIAKRMINGDAKEEDAFQAFVSSDEGNTLSSLLEDGSNNLNSILEWIESLDEDKQEEAWEKVSNLSPEAMKTFVSLDSKRKEIFLKLIKKKKPKESFMDRLGRELKGLNDYNRKKRGG